MHWSCPLYHICIVSYMHLCNPLHDLYIYICLVFLHMLHMQQFFLSNHSDSNLFPSLTSCKASVILFSMLYVYIAFWAQVYKSLIQSYLHAMVWHPWSCWMQASKKPWAAWSHEYCTQHPVTVRDGLNLCEAHFHYHIAQAYGEKRLCNCEACIRGRHVEHVPLSCTQLPCSPADEDTETETGTLTDFVILSLSFRVICFRGHFA